jgi:hypothetical protein
MIKSYLDKETGLYQYYRINIDSRFLNIQLKDGKSNTCKEDVEEGLACDDDITAMENMLPLENFIARGFCIVSLTNITEQQAIEQLSKIILNVDKENIETEFLHISRLLQTVAGTAGYQFGIMPFFTINNKAALLYNSFPYSILVKASADDGIPKKIFSRYINHYISNPGWIEYTPGKKSQLAVRLQQSLAKAGIHYYGCTPVYFNDVLVGILEAAAHTNTAPLSALQLRKISLAIPYVAQLMKMSIEKFNQSIDRIVKDRFTVIQPSVQWKFNEAAWHYFRSHDIEHKDTPFEKISFKDVYPLYGAVDIRNSTIERNKALREDLQLHLTMLISLLQKFLQLPQGEKAHDYIEKAHEWLQRMEDYVSVEEEQQLRDFLFGEADGFIHSFPQLTPVLLQEREEYRQAIEETNGVVFQRRRQLEDAMQLINREIGKHLELFKDELYKYYPVYFDKFRTDGIDYDIYAGQSLAPKVAFTKQHLSQIRYSQVQSMAEITRVTASLLPLMDYPLQTTQLIFVNTRSIDISFRDDERRFDVEGAYNIRYQVIKKRIDKVTIKNSDERLTQPGKIAIVYFNEQDASEFAGYIRDLQKKQILKKDLEYLELQELQGVRGLKALRVGVVIE